MMKMEALAELLKMMREKSLADEDSESPMEEKMESPDEQGMEAMLDTEKSAPKMEEGMEEEMGEGEEPEDFRADFLKRMGNDVPEKKGLTVQMAEMQMKPKKSMQMKRK